MPEPQFLPQSQFPLCMGLVGFRTGEAAPLGVEFGGEGEAGSVTGFFRVQWLAHKSERLPIREEIPGAPDAALRACQPFPAPLGPEFSSFLAFPFPAPNL